MQDKIIVTPSEVRGLGNIVSKKELEDFLTYMSTITSSSEEVDGISRTVYTVEATPPVITLTLTMGKTVLDYDERTTLTATLLDENNTGIGGEEIKFYNENGYLFKTATTDSNGIITIPNVYSHQPGQHTYTGILSSDTTVTGSVTVTINKITSTLSLATSSATVNVGESFTLSGTLNAGSGKSVKIYQNGTVIDTVTTGTNGAYSKSITASAEGSFTYYAVFDGDSVYSDVTSSSVIVTVSAAPVPVPASIVLTSDKQILSYADQDSCTLSATVRDENDVLIEGVTVTFKVDGTSIGTAVTGSNGVATKTYDSQGVGDITCAAEVGMILTKTYSIRDRTFYDASSSEHLSKYTIPTNKSMTYDSSNTCYNCSVSSGSGTDTALLNDLTLSNHCRIKADILIGSTNNSQPRIGLWNGNNGITCRTILNGTSTYFGLSSQTKGNDGSNIDLKQNIGISVNNWYTVIVEYNNGSVSATLKQGDTVISSVSGAETTLGATNSFGIDIGFVRASQFKIKNIEIQEL